MILIADNKSFYSLWISAQNMDPDQRIAGGKKAYRGQFPYMVNNITDQNFFNFFLFIWRKNSRER